MTVSYAGEVPNGSSFGCFWRILWKWVETYRALLLFILYEKNNCLRRTTKSFFIETKNKKCKRRRRRWWWWWWQRKKFHLLIIIINMLTWELLLYICQELLCFFISLNWLSYMQWYAIYFILIEKWLNTILVQFFFCFIFHRSNRCFFSFSYSSYW